MVDITFIHGDLNRSGSRRGDITCRLDLVWHCSGEASLSPQSRRDVRQGKPQPDLIRSDPPRACKSPQAFNGWKRVGPWWNDRIDCVGADIELQERQEC